LTEPSNGQARIEAVDANGGQVALTDISSISLATGNYHDLIFNSFVGGTIGDSGGTERITVVDNQGDISTTDLVLGNGENFMTIVAINGQEIVSTSIQIIDGPGFTDLRQVRISTLTAFVPEPSTMVLAGTSLIGLLAAHGWRRRRQA